MKLNGHLIRPDDADECSNEVQDYISGLEDLKEAISTYLQMHEDDIACEMNDFGDLRLLFIGVFGRIPIRKR
jgi:hypothetical protein